jgi:integrase
VLADRIVLHPEQTKTAATHEIPLTSLMRGIIERQVQTTSPLVFPSRLTGRAVTGHVTLKQQIIDDAGAGHWTLHDLRRTCRTLMSRLGVADSIAELAIGHTPKGLSGIYNLDTGWTERTDAFQRVSDHIFSLVRNAHKRRSSH